jgi:uncharacterized protein (TIGR00251 family)
MARLSLKVVPGAKQAGVAGRHGGAFKIRLQAPPVDGKANRALIDFLAGILGVPRASVRILRGETSTLKTVEVASLGQAEAEARLLEKSSF